MYDGSIAGPGGEREFKARPALGVVFLVRVSYPVDASGRRPNEAKSLVGTGICVPRLASS